MKRRLYRIVKEQGGRLSWSGTRVCMRGIIVDSKAGAILVQIMLWLKILDFVGSKEHLKVLKQRCQVHNCCLEILISQWLLWVVVG